MSTEITDLLAADAAKVRAARERTEPRPCHVCGADHMAEIVRWWTGTRRAKRSLPDDAVRDLCDIATRQRRALEAFVASGSRLLLVQGETVPVLNDEFVRASWMREEVGKTLAKAGAILEGKP